MYMYNNSYLYNSYQMDTFLLQSFTLKSPCSCPTTSGVCGVNGNSGSVEEESSDPGVVGIVLMCL